MKTKIWEAKDDLTYLREQPPFCNEVLSELTVKTTQRYVYDVQAS